MSQRSQGYERVEAGSESKSSDSKSSILADALSTESCNR